MKTITVKLTDQEALALEGVGISPQDWLELAVKTRAAAAMDEIISLFIERANREGVQIPIEKEAIIQEAIKRGWV